MTTNNQSSSYQEAPVIMFLHEDELSNATIDALTDASPFPVSFHKFVFDQPRDKQWENEKDLNYKRMCAFWFHYFFELDFLPDYVMRMDTDSCLTSDMDIDPFEYMIENNVEYIYHSTFFDPPSMVEELYDFVVQHPAGQGNVNRSLALWWGNPAGNMQSFSTNLEFMYIPAFRTPQVLEWKEEVWRNGGIFRKRWGDAPLRAVVTSLFFNKSRVSNFCHFTYNHSSWTEMPMCTSPGPAWSLENIQGWNTVYRNKTTGAVVEANTANQHYTEHELIQAYATKKTAPTFVPSSSSEQGQWSTPSPSRKSAIVYLGNEGHFGSQRSGRPSCGSILESLQSLARHLPLVAMTTNN
jgi:Glycolipid 2-alpha-mannosyltransferase